MCEQARPRLPSPFFSLLRKPGRRCRPDCRLVDLCERCRRFFCLELSSQVQHLIEKDFKGRSPTKAFARTQIDLVSEGREEGGIKRL